MTISEIMKFLNITSGNDELKVYVRKPGHLGCIGDEFEGYRLASSRPIETKLGDKGWNLAYYISKPLFEKLISEQMIPIEP